MGYEEKNIRIRKFLEETKIYLEDNYRYTDFSIHEHNGSPYIRILPHSNTVPAVELVFLANSFEWKTFCPYKPFRMAHGRKFSSLLEVIKFLGSAFVLK